MICDYPARGTHEIHQRENMMGKIRNSNIEIRNNIKTQNSNVPNVADELVWIWYFGHWDLFRISDLGFRIYLLFRESNGLVGGR
jgi:hypothetical protein